MKKELDNITFYKGFELFYDDCYYGLIACRPKGNKNFEEAHHFKTMDEAKEYVDKELANKRNEILANIYRAEKEDENSYIIKVSKMPINIFHATSDPSSISSLLRTFSIEGEAFTGEDYVCDIESKNLTYSQNMTVSGKLFHGLQCNFHGEDEKHEKIKNLCSEISKLLLEVHKLNNE